MVQLKASPLMVFARVDRSQLRSSFCERLFNVCLNRDGLFLCAEGKLLVGPYDLRPSRVACDCNHIVCYQYGAKSKDPVQWNLAWMSSAGEIFSTSPVPLTVLASQERDSYVY